MSSHRTTSSSNREDVPNDAQTEIVEFLKNLEIPTFEDSIWSTEGLKIREDKFNAAMSLLSIQQFGQPVEFTPRQYLECCTTRFLDRLALLFACEKGAKANLHVTATGLLQDNAQLEKWFRLDSDQPASGSGTKDNFGLKQIRDFWSVRTKYYQKQVIKLANDTNWEAIGIHKQRIKHYMCATDKEKKNFDNEWKEVERFRSVFQDQKSDTDLSEEELKKLYLFWQRPSLQRHPTPGPSTLLESRASDGQSGESLVEFRASLHEPLKRNRKVVHFIFLEQVVLPVYKNQSQADWNHNHGEIAAMPVFKLFRRWQDVKQMMMGNVLEEAEFDLVSKLRSVSGVLLKSENDLLEKLQGKIRLTNEEEQERKNLKIHPDQVPSARLGELRRRENFSKLINPAPKVPKYLHCELQILMLFHQAVKRPRENLEPYDFIGCSKLSCYMCWEVLKTSKYKTRGTHGHIHKFWAFPLPRDLPGVSDQFESLSRQWEEQLAKVTPIDSPEGLYRLFETAPAHTAVPLSKADKQNFEDLLKESELREVITVPEADFLPGRGPKGSIFNYRYQNAHPSRRGGFATVRAAKMHGLDDHPHQVQRLRLDIFDDRHQEQTLEEILKLYSSDSDDRGANAGGFDAGEAARADAPVPKDSAPDTPKASYSRPKYRDLVAVKEVCIGDNEKKLICLLQEHDILKSLKRCRGRENVVALKHACFSWTPELVVYLVVKPWAQETLGDLLLDSSTKLRPWRMIPREKLWRSHCIRGLDFLHSHGITHNDLKPHNILLAPSYSAPKGNIRAVITDFNISQRDDHDHGKYNGSREFMAPELQVPLGATSQSDIKPTALSDMWSLGCCLALILLYLHSGTDKMNKFWGQIREPDDPCQDRGLHNPLHRQLMDQILDSKPLKKKTEISQFFIEKFRVIVDNLLQVQRPDASKALEDVKTLLGISLDARLQGLLQNDTQQLRAEFQRAIQ